MSELYFQIGKSAGFTSGRSSSEVRGYSTPIRELFQNSIDASKEAGKEVCKVKIYVESIAKSEIPCMSQYEEYLEKMIEYHKSTGSFNDNAKERVKQIKEALEQEYFDVLIFADNGKGMPYEILNGLLNEQSIKADEGSGGSFGEGHFSSYFLSSLKYVLYASKFKKDDKIESLFSGTAELAGFVDEKGVTRGKSGVLVAKPPAMEGRSDLEYPTQFPSFMADKIVSDTGAAVCIIGLNEDWNTDAYLSIASNFFHSFHNKNLEVEIFKRTESQSIPSFDITADLVQSWLYKNKDGKRAESGHILSGEANYQAWETINSRENKKTISLSNGDSVTVYIENSIDIGSTVVVVRNGMLICRHDKMLSKEMDSLRKNTDYEPFFAVIDLKKDECPNLFSLVKGAESAHHDHLKKGHLSRNNEKILKSLLKELAQEMQPHLKQISRDGFAIKLPFLEMAEDISAQTQSESKSRPGSQSPKATRQKKTAKPKRKIKPGSGKKRLAPDISSRFLESKNIARFKDNGSYIDLHMMASPSETTKSRDDVYLSLNISIESDSDESGEPLEIERVFLDGEEIVPTLTYKENDEEKVDKTQIRLGALEQSRSYDIQAQIIKPKGLKVKFGIEPYLGLKQAR